MKQRSRAVTGRWVVKLGSSLVTNNGLGLDRAAIADWAGQLVGLQQSGIQVVLVSSGAVAEGVARLNLPTRPRQIHRQQAAAAVGQMGLIQAYEYCFKEQGLQAAQILLTHEDLSDRTRYLNARSTLLTLLGMDTVPVVNENDTVATAELCLGDNDTLAGLVSNLVNADRMVILTDQEGLYSADPRISDRAELISHASASDSRLMRLAGTGTELGRGGMQTKLSAARLASRSGTSTVIANGRRREVLIRLMQGERLGTLLEADREPMAARKQWIAGQLIPAGRLLLDQGAVAVLQKSGRSLLAVGILSVSGEFRRGEVVACADESGQEIARGLVNYDSQDIEKLSGQSSDRIEEVLGFVAEEEIIHRDNLILGHW